jgi:hypothetical protein
LEERREAGVRNEEGNEGREEFYPRKNTKGHEIDTKGKREGN